MGVTGFRDMHKNFVEMASLHEHITIEDIGNAAVYLCSDWAAKVTGEIHYVDSGYNIMAAPEPGAFKEQKGESRLLAGDKIRARAAALLLSLLPQST